MQQSLEISPVAVKRAKSYIFNDKVVFYSQHQDDETIFAGSAIIDAVEAVGAENVYIVLSLMVMKVVFS